MKYLENLGKRRSTREIFREDHINGKKFLDWVNEIFSLSNIPKVLDILDLPLSLWHSIGKVRVQESSMNPNTFIEERLKHTIPSRRVNVGKPMVKWCAKDV